MTLRQYLDARTRRDNWIMIAVLVPCVAVWASGSSHAWVGPAAFVVFGGLMHIRATGIPCPRCKGALGRFGYRYSVAITGPAPGYFVERAEESGKCPHCRLRFDEEIDER